MAKRFRVIDADGHCIEHDEQIAQYATYQGRSLKNADRSCFSYFPSLDGWFRPPPIVSPSATPNRG